MLEQKFREALLVFGARVFNTGILHWGIGALAFLFAGASRTQTHDVKIPGTPTCKAGILLLRIRTKEGERADVPGCCWRPGFRSDFLPKGRSRPGAPRAHPRSGPSPLRGGLRSRLSASPATAARSPKPFLPYKRLQDVGSLSTCTSTYFGDVAFYCSTGQGHIWIVFDVREPGFALVKHVQESLMRRPRQARRQRHLCNAELR